MPGLNCAQWNAARIPPKGLVFGAIDPAMYAVGVDARKETQQYAGQIARRIYPAAPAAIGSSKCRICRPQSGVKAPGSWGRADASNSRLCRPFIRRDDPSKPAFCVPAVSSGAFTALLSMPVRLAARQRARPFGPSFGWFPRKKCRFPCRRAKILLQPLRRRSFSRRRTCEPYGERQQR